ncbi:TetR/AcrR family transcriptional regulator [Nocardioides marmoriginsengisoli]|uniref:TetR/AcrR family transcriptional regulator n=1 Tax=Nocardioides marmoriginsengisoli TaxID=661483 RepID=A0A3N0CGE6_9ACTN|nr:TetR/AcrR family transcriptional regulator [Nocardioides marmoriginsengisoli]RNL62086.1 TetR/AcrR family transcriptional regulator [Nocardioides marmoriginsengisoli]
MRSHGWGGEPPADADEARARILAATRARLAEAGTTNTSEIAEAIGVTRQTVYRYYPTTEELLNAAALDAVADLVDQLAVHVRKHLVATSGDAADAVVEVVAYVYEHLRDDPALNRLIAPGRISSTLSGLTAQSSIALGGKLLAGFGIDWSEVGLAEDDQLDLVEHLLRILQSFVLDPGEPARTGDEVRAYLRRWVAPAVRDGRARQS